MAFVSSLAIYLLSSGTVRGKLISDGRQITAAFATQSTLALLYQSAENAHDAARATLAFPEVHGIAVYDLSYDPLLMVGDKNIAPTLPGPQWPRTLQLERETAQAWYFVAPVYSRMDSNTEDDSPFEPLPPQPELIGFVRVALGKGTLQRVAADILRGNLLVSVTLALMLLLLLMAITKRMTLPLQELAARMKRAEGGEKGVRAEVRGPEDITDMENAFNAMMDVLEKRERELKDARDVAIESARIKGEFVANVSHELRTPMNGILGMLELLGGIGVDREVREYLDTARTSAESLLELINELLDFARIEAGRLKLHIEDFDLREILEDVLQLLAGQAQRKGLDIGYLMEPAIRTQLRGDSTRLRQILINLIGNAVKFTDAGEIGIAVRQQRQAENSRWLRFEVRDTGIGVAREASGRIFESFSQADGSTTRRYGGTGLGLAICRELVDLMGGELGLESELGVGSTFWFVVPFEEAARAAPREDAVGRDLNGLHVLIVDDSSVSRRFLETTLRAWGTHCSSVADETQALEMLRSAAQRGQPYDLALVDQSMCGLESRRFVHCVREEEAIARVPIILMIDCWQSNAGEAETPQVTSYVRKPVRESVLYENIRAIVQPQPRSARGAAVLKSDIEPPPVAGYVLVAEDNRVNQHVAQAMLGRMGCRVDLVADGEQAVEAVDQGSYDLVFMDCNMPRVDGYEATARIRALEGIKSQVPIIALTANVREDDSERCILAGMDDYLPKPLNLQALREKLQCWLAPQDVEAQRRKPKFV